MSKTISKVRKDWVEWLKSYGGGKFFDAFVRIAQDAKGTCSNCKLPIYLDIVEGGGVPDWRTEDGDYGCADSPDTNSDGTGGHEPEKLKE